MANKTLKDMIKKVNWELTPELHLDDGKQHGGAVWLLSYGETILEATNWAKECRDKFGNSATCDFWMEKLDVTEEDLDALVSGDEQ